MGKFSRIFYVITSIVAVLLICNFIGISDMSHGSLWHRARATSLTAGPMKVNDKINLGTFELQKESEKAEEVTTPPPHPTPNSPMFILILSSLPRSGSTFFSEMMSQIKDSVLFFEPLWIQQHTNCSQNGDCVEKYLGDIFTCNYKPDFEEWLKSKGLFLRYFNSEVLSCLNKGTEAKKQCFEVMSLHKMCLESPVRIIKVIRARMQWLEKTLMNSTINFKLIHITRDPRGSMNSISNIGWGNNPYDFCSVLEADMNTYEVFSKQYPSKVLQVSLETLSLQPFVEMARIFKFLYGTSDLPEAIKGHIKSHTTEKKGGSDMSTHKKSAIEFDAWRWKITEDLLKRVENEQTCLEPIIRMNHAVFSSLVWARDASKPLIIS